MIILRLKGGLGNQIFQVVHALNTAQSNEKIWVDYSHFFYTFGSDYAGLELGINKVLEPDQLKRLSFFKMQPSMNRVLWKFINLLGFTNTSKNSTVKFLDGYFHQASLYPQTTKYRNLFQLNEKSTRYTIDKNSVLIHVRKGDYTNSVNSLIYTNCDIDYFKKCVEHMKRHNPQAKFFVASNDNTWVANNFQFLGDYQILEINDTIESFKTMCQFSNFIISNSTFSWWPAFLSESPYVIAPKKWFIDDSKNLDIYPSEWIKI